MTRRFADFSKPAPPIWRFKDTVIVVLASTVAVGAFVGLGLLFLLVKPAGAHEAMGGFQYPWEYCAGHDCSEIAASRVKEAPGGYVVDGRFPVRHSEVKQSPDGHYHACFPNP